MSTSSGAAEAGPPYPPATASLGLTPSNTVDTPISAVFIVLFIGSAVLHMTFFQRNRRRGHKFVLSGLLFGLSMARITANVMRIVWANYPSNARIAIAASILANAGVLLLFVVNLVLSQRILRAHHPLGWHRLLSLAYRVLYALVVGLLIMVIVSTVYSFYTLDGDIRAQLHDVQLVASTALAVVAFLPVPIVLLAVLLPHGPVENFGQGSMSTKVALVLFTAVLLALGASFRAAVAYMPRPIAQPAWYHSKACYYCFNYTIEIVCVYLYALARFDLRFHVPDGASRPGHYSGGVPPDMERLAAVQQPTEREKETRWESQLQNELNRRESA